MNENSFIPTNDPSSSLESPSVSTFYQQKRPNSNQIPTISFSHNSRIRIIQFQPAWSLHALLRFHNLPYTCENSIQPISLGNQLPCLLDGKYLLPNNIALEHLQYGRIIRNDKSFILQDIKKKNSNDVIMGNYIQNSIVKNFHYLKKSSGLERKELVKSTSFLIRWPLLIWKDLHNSLFGESNGEINNLEINNNLKENELLMLLKESYIEFDEILKINEGFLIPNIETRGMSDALLFGHIADALCFESTSEIIKKYNHLITFFTKIAKDYFFKPISINNSNNNDIWMVASLELISNNFLSSDRIRNIIYNPINNLNNLLVDFNNIDTFSPKPNWIMPYFDSSIKNIFNKFSSSSDDIINTTNDNNNNNNKISISVGSSIYLTVIFSCFINYGIKSLLLKK